MHAECRDTSQLEREMGSFVIIFYIYYHYCFSLSSARCRSLSARSHSLYVAQCGCVCLSQRDAVCMHCCPVCRSPFAVVIAMTSRKWPSSKNVTNYKYVLSFQSSQLMFVYTKSNKHTVSLLCQYDSVGHHIPYTTYTDILSIIHSFYIYCLFDYVSNKIVFRFRAEFIFFSLIYLSISIHAYSNWYTE